MKIRIQVSYQRDDSYKYLAIFGVIVFILSNAYFGWNQEAKSGWEALFDVIWVGTFFGGILGMTIQGIIQDVLKRVKYELIGKGE